MKVTSQHPGGTLSGKPSVAPENAVATGKSTSTNKIGLDQIASEKSVAKPTLPSSEKVNLSQRVQDMQKIKALATPDQSINEAKVARLQKLIDAGEYKVDAEAVADRLVDEHLNIPT